MDKQTKKIFYDKLEYKFIELPKFTKTEERMSYDSSLKAKWDYENVLDYAVRTAEEKAREESKVEFVKNLLKNTDFTATKISLLAEVTEELVLDIQQQLVEEK